MPHDGKRKKPSYSRHIRAPILNRRLLRKLRPPVLFAFIIRMVATRRMPLCAGYFIDRPFLTCQKKPCSHTGSAGLLLCTIQCSCFALHTAIMPGWPFSVCWAFLLPPENLPASKKILGNFQKSGQNRVFQVSY